MRTMADLFEGTYADSMARSNLEMEILRDLERACRCQLASRSSRSHPGWSTFVALGHFTPVPYFHYQVRADGTFDLVTHKIEQDSLGNRVEGAPDRTFDGLTRAEFLERAAEIIRAHPQRTPAERDDPPARPSGRRRWR